MNPSLARNPESPATLGLATALGGCDSETVRSFEAAEALFEMTRSAGGKGFARSAVFAFCFAVENEVRLRLGGKLRKLLNKGGHEASLTLLLDPRGKRLSPFFQRYLILARKTGNSNPLEYASLENYLHVLARMAELGPKFKPDGLKAFGVILICLATDFSLDDTSGTSGSGNPGEVRACLRLKVGNLTEGTDIGVKAGDEAVRALACGLIKLQHLRNPYVHPQSGDMKNISEVRQETEQCLKGIQAIA